MYKYQQSGFTIIELLVTTAVIGILASFGIANFSNYRNEAYKVAALNQAKNFFTSALAGDGVAQVRNSTSYTTFTARWAPIDDIPRFSFSYGDITATPENISRYLPGYVHDPLIGAQFSYYIHNKAPMAFGYHCKVFNRAQTGLPGIMFSNPTSTPMSPLISPTMCP